MVERASNLQVVNFELVNLQVINFGRAFNPRRGQRPTTGVGPIVHVLVRDNNVDQALRALKKKMQREGIFREMKLRRSYEKPSEKRAREQAEAVRRARKLLRKRMDREGF